MTIKSKGVLKFFICCWVGVFMLGDFALGADLTNSYFNLTVGTDGGVEVLKRPNDVFDTNYVMEIAAEDSRNFGDIITYYRDASSEGVYKAQISNSSGGSLLIADGQTVSDFTLEASVSVTSGQEGGLVFRTGSHGTVSQGLTGYYVGLFPGFNEVRFMKTNGSNFPTIASSSMTLSSGTDYQVKVVATGSSFQIYVDDMSTALITATDSDHTSGGFGLRAYSGTLVADDIVQGSFSDNFNDGQLDGWSTYGGTSSIFTGSSSGWVAANTGSHGDSVRSITSDSSKITVSYPGMNSDFDLTETYELDGESLKWEMTFENLTANPLEFGDIGLPFLFNTKYVKDTTTTYTQRVVKHSFVSGDGSYIYWNRPNGVGPYLVMTPLDGTSLEYWDRTTVGDNSNADDDDFNSVGGWEGLYTAFIHSKRQGGEIETQGTWRQDHTSVTLAANGEANSSVTYGFKFTWADDVQGVRDILYNDGGIDVSVFPGMTIPKEFSVKLALRTSKTINSITPEFSNATTITSLGTATTNVHLYQVEFSQIGENKLTVEYDSGKELFLEFFVTEPLKTLYQKRAEFMVNKQQHKNTGRWYEGLFSLWDPVEKTLRSPRYEVGGTVYSNLGVDPDRSDGKYLQEYMVGGSDDPSLPKAPTIAGININYPDTSQIQAVEYYIENFLWDGLQRTDSAGTVNNAADGSDVDVSYAIFGSENWNENKNCTNNSGGRCQLRHWRSFDYTHITQLYYNMYRIDKLYPDKATHLTASEYLDRAYHTAKAFFEIPYNIYMSGWDFEGYSDWAFKQGNFHEVVIVSLIEALEEEGRTSDATTLRTHWENKVKYMVYDHPYPYGSEMYFDTTAFESTHAIAKYGRENTVPTDTNGFYDKNQNGPGQGGYTSHPSVEPEDFVEFMQKETTANLAARGVIEPAYYLLGSDIRGGGNSAYTLNYMTQLGGWSILDYALYYATSDKEREDLLRVGYAAYLGPFALINVGEAPNYGYWYNGVENNGSAAWAFEPEKFSRNWNGNREGRGPWRYDGEIDSGFAGARRAAATIVLNDSIFGNIAYGGLLTENGDGSFTIAPKDGIQQRFHMFNFSTPLRMETDRDGFESIDVSSDGLSIDLTLENRTNDAHTTNLTLDYLVGNYTVSIDGGSSTIHSLTSSDKIISLTLSAGTTHTVSIEVTPNVLFSDDFNDGNMNGWTTFDGTWTTTGGVLSVNAGPGYKASVDSQNYADFTLEAKITRSGASGDAGVIFRASDLSIGGNAYDGYYFGIRSNEAVFGKAKASDGSWYEWTPVSGTYSVGVEYTLKVVTSGTSIKAYVDDQLIFDLTDSDYSTGTYGVRTWQLDATFDDFQVSL